MSYLPIYVMLGVFALSTLLFVFPNFMRSLLACAMITMSLVFVIMAFGATSFGWIAAYFG